MANGLDAADKMRLHSAFGWQKQITVSRAVDRTSSPRNGSSAGVASGGLPENVLGGRFPVGRKALT